ncbi:MAG: sugar transferase [Bacteroidales bacterium]|nr:sugar transferase [Bacteroidales bacterium]
MKKKQTIKYIICDTLSAMLAWTALFLFRKLVLEESGYEGLGQVFHDVNFWLGIVIVPIGWLALYTIQGTYRNVLRRARLKELIETLLATLIGVVVIFFVLLIDDEMPTYRDYYATFLFLLAIHFVLTYLPRLVITSWTVRRVHDRRIGFPTLMIGAGNKALHTYMDVENQETYSGNLFVGYVEVGTDRSNPATDLEKVMPRLGTLSDLRRLVEEHHVEEAIIAVEDNEQDKVNDILLALNSCGDIIIKITPDARDLIIGSIKQESIFHSPLIIINNRLMSEWQYSLKRIFDIVISLLAMVLLSPVYLVTAIIVKCTSPGPVFYAQERIGYHGKPFKMHKFRSMYVDAEKTGPALSKDDDPRITPFGRFMRKVRLDEIPQFFNVLKGTMSIVGPRPERQFYIDQIVKRAPEYLLLQRIKPGITSWGQVKYGYASTVDEMVERLRYDLLYLDNMSLTTDLKILVYTVIIILQGRGK